MEEKEKLTEIKKELYKTKPIAFKIESNKESVIYMCMLYNRDFIFFDIPKKEANFENEINAHLLIRWIVK